MSGLIDGDRRFIDRRWGENRERGRRRRAIGIMAVLFFFVALSVLALQVAADGHGVFDHRASKLARAFSPAVRIAAGCSVTLAGLVFARVNWLASDELRRAEIKDFWAAIGFAMLTTFPLLHVLGPYTTAEARLALTYGAGMAGGVVWHLWRTATHRLARRDGV